jgi:hypothetical protein
MRVEEDEKRQVQNDDPVASIRRGFFYKYNPLSNVIVKNNPLQNLLPKIAWRKGEKAPRGTSANGC